MKKYFIILVVLCATTLQMSAQKKGDWGEVFMAFNNSLLLTSDDLHLNKQNRYRPYLDMGLEVRVIQEWVAYLEMQVPLVRVKRFESNINQFGELDEENNLSMLEGTLIGRKRGGKSHMNFGIGYRIYVVTWRLTPQIGMGLMDFRSGTDCYQLKEMGTSNMYAASYSIGRTSYSKGTLNQLQFRLKAQRKLGEGFSLNMGVGYSLFLNRIKYEAKYFDYFTDEILEASSAKNRPHEFSFSVGIGFR